MQDELFSGTLMLCTAHKKVNWATVLESSLRNERKIVAEKKQQRQCDTANGHERQPQFSCSYQGFILHRP